MPDRLALADLYLVPEEEKPEPVKEHLDDSDVTLSDLYLGVSPDESVGPHLEDLRYKEEEEKPEEMGRLSKSWHRGVEHLQAGFYGAVGAVGQALEQSDVAPVTTGAISDWGYEGYLRNLKEAEKYPRESGGFTETIKSGSPGKMGVWAVETFGELAPSMVEAAFFATAAATATAVSGAPQGAPLTGLAAFFGKRAVRKMIENRARKYIEKGISRKAAEKLATKEADKIAKRALLGSRTGIVAGTAPVETGLNWGEAMEQGIENPWSAIATGTAAGFIELAGGHYRIIRKWLGAGKADELKSIVDKCNKAQKATSKDISRIAMITKEAALQGGGEFAQEASQEFLSLANIAWNDPTFSMFTQQNLTRIVDAGAAGALMGLTTGAATGAVSAKPAPLSDMKQRAEEEPEVTPEIEEKEDIEREVESQSFDDLVKEGLDVKYVKKLEAVKDSTVAGLKEGKIDRAKVEKRIAGYADAEDIESRAIASALQSAINEYDKFGPDLHKDFDDFKNNIEDAFVSDKDGDALEKSAKLVDDFLQKHPEANEDDLNKVIFEAEERGKKAIARKKELEEKEKKAKEEKEKAEKDKLAIPDFNSGTEAQDFGKTATPEQVEELKRIRDALYAKAEASLKEGKLDISAQETFKAGFYREAVEASEGTIKPPKVPPSGEKKGTKIGESKPEKEEGEGKGEKEGEEKKEVSQIDREKEKGTIVQHFPFKDLHLDAGRFQYKRGADAEGVTGTLSGPEKYKETYVGTVQVWRDPANNKVYVSDGHQRYNKGKLANIETIPVRFSEADTAEEAKYEAALINISRNNGTPEDAAVVFREKGMTADELQKKHHINLKGKIARKGLALSRLHPTIFHSVEMKEIPQNWGVVIGNNLENQDMQIDLIRYLDKAQRRGKTVNVGTIEQLIKDLKGETVGKVKVEDVDMFGKESFERPLLMERAELRDYAISELAQEKKLFGVVGKESTAKKLTIGGNVINVEKSKTVAEKAALIKDIFEKLAGSKGEVSDLLNTHAQELSDAKGKGEKDRIKRSFLERLRETINEFVQRGERPSAGESRADAERGLFEGTAKEAEKVEAKKKPAKETEIKGSRARRISKGISSGQAKFEIAEHIGEKATNALLSSGIVRVVSSKQADSDGVSPNAVGYIKSGISHIVHDRIGKGDTWEVLMHELGAHWGFEAIFGKGQAQKIFDRFASKRNDGTKLGKAIDDAFKQVPEGTREELVNEEALAYFIQANAHLKSSNPIGFYLRPILTRIKAWLVKVFGVDSKIFNAQDYVNIARGSIRHGTMVAAEMQGRKAKGESKEVFYSVTAWHGSPYEFEDFSIGAIGQGEGAQAFGWGLYFTELEDIGKHYANMGMRDRFIYNGVEHTRDSFEDTISKEYGPSYKAMGFTIAYDWLSGYNTDDIIRLHSKKWGESIVREVAEGLERPSADSNRWVVRVEGGIREEKKMSRNEQMAFFDIKGRAGWLSKNNKHPLETVKKELERTVEVQQDRIKNDKYVDIKEAKRLVRQAKDALGVMDKYRLAVSWPSPRRNLYKVTLHKGKDPSDYTWLDWDKPVDKNIWEKVKAQAKKEAVKGSDLDDIEAVMGKVLEEKGNYLYHDLAEAIEDNFNKKAGYSDLQREFIKNRWGDYSNPSEKEASLFLLRAGIDGIRYPAGSLSGMKDTGAKNYVVFDEKAVSIDEHVRYSEDTSRDKDELDKILDDFFDSVKQEESKEDLKKQFGEIKDTPPPNGATDPKIVDSWLADQADAFAKTIIHYKNTPLNTFEKIVTSPEWWQHPKLRKIVRIFTRSMPELYHNYFNHLDNAGYSKTHSVIQQLKSLKYKGIPIPKRLLTKEVSPQYEFYNRMITEVDTNQKWRLKPGTKFDEHYWKIATHFREQWDGTPADFDEIMDAFVATRTSYERGLALQRQEMEKSLASLGKKRVSKVDEIKFGDTSTKRYGKQIISTGKEEFDTYFTVTSKTALKWDLPVRRGITYTIGHIKGKDRNWLDVHSVNFDKEIFDESTATAWWRKNKVEVGIPVGETSKNRAMRQALKTAIKNMGRLSGSYAARVRDTGDYAVVAHKKLESGEVETYLNFRSNYFSAGRLKKQLEKDGWVADIKETKEFPSDVYENLRAVSVAAALEEAANRAERKGSTDKDLALAFRENIIEQTVNEIRARGYRGTMIHRKGGNVVLGYNEDPMERLIIWMNRLSAGLSKSAAALESSKLILGEYKEGEKVGGIHPSKEKDVWKVANQYVGEQLRASTSADRLVGLAKSLTTLKFLGFNIRSVLVNLTAMLTTAPPAIHNVLNKKASLTEIGRELTSAGTDYARFLKTGKLNNQEETDYLVYLQKVGYDDPQYCQEALSDLDRTHNKAFGKLLDASMWMFGIAEKWNRGSTMLATYRLAKKYKVEPYKAMELAKQASDTAHGVYGKATRPLYAMGDNPFARGAGMFYMYSKFGHNYVQLCYDLGFRKHNMKAFMYAILAPIVLGGIGVAPFKDELVWFFNKLFKIIGVHRDVEKWVWDTTRSYIGGKGELIARHGVSGLMGVDISHSLSIGVGTPQGLIDLIGAPGSVAEGFHQSWGYLAGGQYMRAVEKATPRGVENLLRAYREKQTGLVTEKGRRVWSDEIGVPYKPSLAETAQRATGFRSAKQAVAAEKKWESQREEKSYSQRKSRIYERYRAYLAHPRIDVLRDIKADIREFNKDVRKYNINVSRIDNEALKRQRTRMSKPTKREAERIR